MDRITSFLNDLPGYTGYRDKESRRDSDKRLRDSIASQLASIADRVERAGATLVQRRELEKSQAIEQLVRSLNHAANRISSQSYGYGGIFSDTPVDERALAQLFLFDKGLATKVGQLDAQLATVETDLTSGSPIEPVIDEARKSLQSLLDLLDTRGTVVETAAPAPPRSVFAPLDESRDTLGEPAAPIEISVGDAISHLGDDYIVNALIEVRDEDSTVRLFRVETDPGKWLAIADHGPRMAALLEEQSGGASAGSHAAGGTVSWSLAGVGEVREQTGKPVKADASVILYEWKDDPQRVALEVHSGTDERYLSGHRVHPDDLAVYGKPGSTG
jgi:hypothetical protein